MKLWIDDIRIPPSEEYIWIHSVEEAKTAILFYLHNYVDDIIIIDLDHDAGDYIKNGGDYIKLLNWLEQRAYVDKGFFFHIYSMNPVGVENMRRIIIHNNWQEIK